MSESDPADRAVARPSRLRWEPPPRPTRRECFGIVLLLLAGAGLRIAVVRATPDIDPAYHGTAAGVYLDVARSVAQGTGFVWNGMPATQHPPGYSLYLASALRFSPASAPLVARLGQALLDACVMALVWAVARRMAPPWAAWVAAACYAVLPEFVLSAPPLLADGFMPLWWALVVYTGLRWAETGQVRWAALLGGAGALAMLWRSETVLLGPAVVLWAAVARRQRTDGIRGALVVFVVVCALFGPWWGWTLTLRLQGQPRPSQAATTVLSGLGQFPNRYGLLTSDRFTGAVVQSRGLPWHLPEGDAYCAALAKRIATTDPWVPARAILGRQWMLLGQTNLPHVSARSPLRIANRLVILAGFALAAYGVAAARISWWQAAVLGAPWLLYCGTLGLLYYEPRYGVPAHLSALWLGAAALQPVSGTRWRRGVAIAGVTVALLVALGWAWERWSNNATVKRLSASSEDARWQPAEPHIIGDAVLTRARAGGLQLEGPTGTRANPGFLAVWADIPTVPGDVASVLVQVEVEAGQALVGLFQTIQFPGQPPEHLWVARHTVAAPGDQTVVLPVENFTGQPLHLGIMPVANSVRARPGGPGSTEQTCRIRIRIIRGWPTERGPTRPWSRPRTHHPSAT